MKLTASQVKSAKPAIKAYKLSDGRGLYLLVQPNGAKYWRLKYRLGRKEKLLAIGVYPDISLAQARAACDEAKALLRDNRDPSSVKQLRKNFLVEQSNDTFEAIATEWFEHKMMPMSVGYKARTWRLLENDLFPTIGKSPIAEVSAVQLLEALRTIERRTVYIAHRAKQACSQIFRYAISTGRTDRDIAFDLTGALRPRTVKHAATLLDPNSIGQLLRSIDAYSGSMVVRGALQLSPLLFVRPGELRTMEWQEINWDKQRWEIPSSKMKMREAHIVPLAKQSLEVLAQMEPLTGRGSYVFPSARKGGRPLSDNGVRTALPELSAERFNNVSPVSYALTKADKERLPWVVMIQGDRIRIYNTKNVGVGRRGRTESYVECQTSLLSSDDAGLLWLLFSSDALRERGTFDSIIEESKRFASDVADRLRERIYDIVIPQLAIGISNERNLVDPAKDQLAFTYQMALTVLFRLLFIACAEDRDLLPYKKNEAYRKRSLKQKSIELAESVANQTPTSQGNHHWSEINLLWDAVCQGNSEWGVPAYDGTIFSSNEDVSPGGAAIAKITLPNNSFEEALRGLRVLTRGRRYEERDGLQIKPLRAERLFLSKRNSQIRVMASASNIKIAM